MAGSSAEREIRDAVAAHLRQMVPSARIVHELVVGQNRADIAAVEPSRLILFEIKSERDVLDNLASQMATFADMSHGAVAVLHERWFDTTPYTNGSARFVRPSCLQFRHGCWSYPEPAAERREAASSRWVMPRPTIRQPHAYPFLNLMWREEMAREASRHGIDSGRRRTMADMAEDMAYLMTGREIVEAVCRQLRLRPFPEADPPTGDAALNRLKETT